MRKREIESLRKQLEKRKGEITMNIIDASNEITGLQQSEVNDEMDMASISLDQLIDTAITTQQSEELAEIEKALLKIETGEFGECEMCGDKISIERLKIKPQARFCITCRPIYEESLKKGKMGAH